MKLYFWYGVPNAGDYFSVWLLQQMKIPFEIDLVKPELCITGSILQDPRLENAKIWGCGLHNATDDRKTKENIYAVRGKLTANKLNLPEIVTGDPGILASYFKPINKLKKYKFGIVSHYIDEQFFNSLKLPDYVKVITMKTCDIDQLLEDINDCEFILSSSLHGIIFAHSYNIPAFRIKHNELATKNAFKFLDYYSNWNLNYIEKNVCTKDDMNFEEFNLLYENKNLFVPTKQEIKYNQEKLLSVFPYKR